MGGTGLASGPVGFGGGIGGILGPLFSGGTAVAEAAPPLIEGVTAATSAVPPAVAALQGPMTAAGGLGPLLNAAQPGATAVAGATPQGIMSALTGPQMSMQAPVVPSFAEGGPLISEAAGGFSGSPSIVSGAKYPTAAKSAPWRENPWVERGAKALKSIGSYDQGGGGGQQQAPPPNFGQAPPPDPFSFGHVGAQQDFMQSLMKGYLTSGGVSYG